MPSPRLARFALLAAVSAAALTLAGCASTPAPDVTQTESAPAPTAPAEEPTPDAEPTEEAPLPEAGATCENIIDADTLAELQANGWTPELAPFTIGGTEFAGGASCTWSGGAGGGALPVFGWAPMAPDEAIAAQAQLEQDGWIREDSADGVYLTEDPQQALTLDEEGYGMTYLFGPGWVTLSDTKAGLPLVTGPQS